MSGEANNKPLRRRRLILTAVGIILALAIILLFSHACSSGRLSGLIYRYTHSGKWLYSALYHGIKNGKTIEQVESFLGPGVIDNSEKLRSVSKKFAETNPSSWPEGVRDDDVFMGFSLDGGTLFLQFRGGVLINFNPTDFAEYDFN